MIVLLEFLQRAILSFLLFDYQGKEKNKNMRGTILFIRKSYIFAIALNERFFIATYY